MFTKCEKLFSFLECEILKMTPDRTPKFKIQQN